MDDKIIVENINYVYGAIFILTLFSFVMVYDVFNSGDDPEEFFTHLFSSGEPDQILIKEKVGLYYSLDDPDKTYLRDGDDDFLEVKING